MCAVSAGSFPQVRRETGRSTQRCPAWRTTSGIAAYVAESVATGCAVNAVAHAHLVGAGGKHDLAIAGGPGRQSPSVAAEPALVGLKALDPALLVATGEPGRESKARLPVLGARMAGLLEDPSSSEERPTLGVVLGPEPLFALLDGGC